MSKHPSRWRSQQWRAELAAAFHETREDELFDAVVSAAALTACADGRVQEVERAQLLEFLDRQDLLWIHGGAEALARFDRHVFEFRGSNEPVAALSRLRRYRDSRAAALILGVCDEIASADCRIDPREERLLRLVRSCLEGGATPADAQPAAPQTH